MKVSERLSDHAEVRRGYLILAISGHQSEASLRNYNGRPSSKQLRACSIILSDALGRRPHHNSRVLRRFYRERIYREQSLCSSF